MLTVKRVTKNQALAATALIEVVAWLHSALWGILATLGLGVICYASIRLHPRTRHTGPGSCHGSGESRNMFFPWRFRKCRRCSGGRLISPMAGRFGSDPIRTEAAKAKQARTAARENHRWR